MKVGIIIGSIRPTRVSDRMAKWIQKELEGRSVDVTMIDLLDYPLPMFNEEVSPMFNPNRKVSGKVAEFLKVVGQQDGIVLVTPEYNRSYSSVLKNALDYIDFQLKRKPVMLAAHGSTGGAQAVSHLRAVIPGLLGVTSPTAVMTTGWLSEIIMEDGSLNENDRIIDVHKRSIDNALTEFLWLNEALSQARKLDSKK